MIIFDHFPKVKKLAQNNSKNYKSKKKVFFLHMSQKTLLKKPPLYS